MASASHTIESAYFAVSLAPYQNTFLPRPFHLPRSHSMPSTLTAVGTSACLSSGSQNPLATLSTSAASKRWRRACRTELSP